MRSILNAKTAPQVKLRTPAYLGMGIGVEEAQVMADLALNDSNEISTEIVEGQRLLDLTDAIEDMAVIAEQLDGELPTTRALVETASRMAVAGTDVEPTEIVPAMESYHGRLAVEGLRAQAETIWKKIKHSMSGIWDKLDHLFTNVVGIYFQVSRNAAIARKELNDALAPKPAAETFKVRNTQLMATAAHSYTNYTDVRDALLKVHATLKWALEDYAINLISIGDTLSKNMKDFEVSKGEHVFTEMEALMRKAITFPGLKKDTEIRNRQGEAYVGEFLPGGVSLVASVYKAGSDLTGRLSALGQHKVELDHSSLHGYVAPREIMFKTMNLEEMVTLLSMIDEISDTADRFCKGSFPKRLKAIRHEVDLATTALYDVAIENEEDRALVKTVKSLALMFPKWVESPIAALLVYTSNFCNAVIKLCEQSGEQYQSYLDQQRVKQLEIENEKLQSHIDELEKEIDALKAAQADMEQQVIVVVQLDDEDEEAGEEVVE